MNYFGDFIVICSVSSLKHWMPRAASTFSTTLTQTVYYSALEEVSTLHIFCHLPASITPLQACFYLQCKLTELHDHIVQKSVYLLCVKYWIYMYHLHKEYSLIHPMNCLQNDVMWYKWKLSCKIDISVHTLWFRHDNDLLLHRYTLN